MKLRQAAVYLNYSPSQLRILVQQGQIPYLPGKGQNGAWRFDLRDLDAFIEREKNRCDFSPDLLDRSSRIVARGRRGQEVRPV
jgi:hypothetical protein